MPLSPEDRNLMFNTIKGAMASCSPPMLVSKDKEGVYELMGNKPVPYGSTKKIVPGMYFCSVVTRKENVTLYFFPIYGQPKEFDKVIPTLKKNLKGKTCFLFKKPEQINTKELNAMLKFGVRAWKVSGYMK